MKVYCPRLILALALLLSLASFARAGAFANGNFESPLVTNEQGYNPIPGSPSPPGTIGVPGWNASGVDHIGSYWPGYNDTAQSVDMNGTDAGLIWQEFDTVVGQEYEVSFALSRNSDGNSPGVLQLGAAVFPTLADFGKAILPPPDDVYQTLFVGSFNTPATGVTGPTTIYDESLWTLHSFRFTATNATSVLAFGGHMSNPATPWGPVIDEVNVVALPEPATMALWSMMSIAAATWGWRKRRS